VNETLLQASGLGKRFTSTVALAGVDLEIRAGEMLALVGANGAGKSTLVKILCGAVLPDTGEIVMDGRPVEFRRVADAQAAGIAVAHQQVAIIGALNGAENIMLGREPRQFGLIDNAGLLAAARHLAGQFGIDLDLSRECDRLDLGELKILDILKALAGDPRILMLDEPTASMTLAESQRLFAFLADLRQRGLGIVFISHHMNEIFAHCDRIVVLKDGSKVHDGPVAAITLPEVVRLMVGRTVEETDWHSHAGAEDEDPVLSLRDVRVGSLHVEALSVRRGEVVGLAGVLGAGQTGLLECVAGASRAWGCGAARVGGLAHLPRSVAQAVAHDIYLVADDRLRKALLRGLSIEENVLAGSLGEISRLGFVQRGAALERVRAVIDRLGIKCSGPHQEVLHLSGGNQQKVVFGRWLARIDASSRPPLLLLDNPTEGVDIGAKAELYGLIREFARRGAAVLIASAEFSELIALCDRVYCIHNHRLDLCLPRQALSEDRLLLEVN